MLNFFRKNTHIIVWAVVVAFVAWGGYSVSLQFEEAYRSPGRIFGKEVSYREYLSTSRAVQIFSPRADDGTPLSMDQLEAQTWQFLIFSREAKRRKIQVTDDEVRAEIARLFSPQPELPFSADQYTQWIRKAFGDSPREFENQLRERLRVQKLFDQVKAGGGSDAEKKLENWASRLIRKAKIEIYKLPAR